ncbi:MAG TPA: hypothetical protein DEP04_08900 [Dehalococcoidia bacterium]|nr:hypothetical protein [Dehalococcoidia bacterium]|tara:strand:- start:1588 stop:2118 length:531 start_codon:yes stop_codon:yes gene_type:complete
MVIKELKDEYTSWQNDRISKVDGKPYLFTATFKNVGKVSSLAGSVGGGQTHYLDKNKIVINGLYDASEKQPSYTMFVQAIDELHEGLSKVTPVGLITAEKGKYGRRHAHGLFKVENGNKGMLQKAMEELWRHNSVFGKVVLSRELQNVDRAVAYVCKYITKDMYSDTQNIPREWSW